MRRAPFLAAALTLLLGLPIQAAEPPLPWTKPFTGAWTLSGLTDGAPYCRLMLGDQGVIGGANLDVSATCRRNFPLEDVAAWTLRDRSIVLIDALRQAVLTFQPAADGSFRATLPGGVGISLDRGAPAAPKSRKDLLDGTFTLSGPNNAAPCGFAVEALSANDGTLEQAGDCPAVWKDRRWKNWSFRAGRLNLLAADGTVILALTPGDGFTFSTEMAGQTLFFGPGVIEQSR